MDIREYVNQKGITIQSEWVSSNPNMQDDGWQANHYKVTLRKERKSYTTYFSMGMAHTNPPTAEDVLNALASDAAGYENARTFEEWAGEYGYDTDSRSAEKTYKIVGRQTERLKSFLGDDYEKVLFEIDPL